MIRLPKRLSLYHRRLGNCEKSGNTWFRMSWHISPPQETKPDSRFVSDNKAFIGLANIIHENRGVSEDLRDLVNQNILKCKNEDRGKKIERNIIKKFQNVSTIGHKYYKLKVKHQSRMTFLI